MDDGLGAAALRFPGRWRALEALAVADGDFGLLCRDLAEAQVALERWRASASGARDRRCSEYAELIESLTDEIALYLDAAEAGNPDAD